MDRRPASHEHPTHGELVESAHGLRQAMLDDDAEGVHRLLCRLRADLVDHLRGERRRLESTRESVGAVVVVGQQRLLDLVDDALLGVDRDPHECNCLARAVEIEIALRRQVRLESRVLDREPLVRCEGG